MSNTWNPDWVLVPGEILYDHLDESGASIEDLAAASGLDQEVIQGVLDGSELITDEIAEGLSRGTGVSALFWSNIEERYRTGLAEGKTVL